MVFTILRKKRQWQSIELDILSGEKHSFLTEVALCLLEDHPFHVYGDGVLFGRHTSEHTHSSYVQTLSKHRKQRGKSRLHTVLQTRFTSKDNSKNKKVVYSFLCFGFRNEVFLHSTDWPWIHNPPVSASWLQGPQTCMAFAWHKAVFNNRSLALIKEANGILPFTGPCKVWRVIVKSHPLPKSHMTRVWNSRKRTRIGTRTCDLSWTSGVCVCEYACMCESMYVEHVCVYFISANFWCSSPFLLGQGLSLA